LLLSLSLLDHHAPDLTYQKTIFMQCNIRYYKK
jgi:hypothetical protein